ncbi:hypothetical protein KI688_004907 [Linnemannia hyalina]|uniref:Uncharacterized protein n=1 Tax=Linnemannia hyalina TaxID=64524 RepID=A0A9P8BNT8_9FUNG|nr:hypothetical protein KI688_004907 [Linnemannia hyalina]
MDTDKVSAAMGNYMLQGWAMLNDGCPDCNTPLMRNREATSQICVNCQLNPPVDPEEVSTTTTTTTETTAPGPASSPAQATTLPPPPPAVTVAAMTTPAPTSALPSLPSTPAPGPFRPPSPQNHRSSTLDPMLEARRALRPVGARSIGGAPPQPPSTPPPRATTPLPMPPGTPPPPPTGAKTTSGPLGLKPANIPRPPGPPPPAPSTAPPALPLSPPPPAGTLLPTLVPRDIKRSPQSSVILSGPILPPSTPPPPPPSAITSGPLPSPPTGPVPPVATESVVTEVLEPLATTAPQKDQETAAATTEEPVEEQEQHSEEIESEVTVEAFEVDEPDADTQSLLEIEQPTETAQEQPQGPVQEQEQPPVQTQEQEEKQEDEQQQQQEATQEQPLEQAQEAEDEEDDVDDGDKTGVESDDDFEDAEEEVFKPSEDEVKERESKREQSERASRLIGQKMLQGWAMLQDPCPNLSCHGVPLLRNREKKEYCVVCDNYFQREQDLEHGKYTIVAPEPVSAPLPPLPPAPTSLPPPPQTPSPALPPQHQAVTSVTSPSIRASSPLASPSFGRSRRDSAGRVSGSIILPPAAPMPSSLASASQQILGKHLSEDLDKLASEDEEARKHIQIIRKGGEYSSRSLPPVPSGPAPPAGSRPTSTYSTSSEYHPSEGERPELKNIRPPRYNNPNYHANGASHLHQQQQQHASMNGTGSEQQQQLHNGPAPPPPAPLSPEVQALVAATHKTMATILVKLEAYRLALEVAESPKECQALTAQIKGLMECLKACRETL